MKRLLHILFFLLLFTICFGQSKQGQLHGSVMDSIGNKNVVFATVSVFRAADTALLSYALTNPEGKFRVQHIPLNVSCRLVITCSGYSAVRKDFILSDQETLIDLGNIIIASNSGNLEEVIIKAETPPIIVRRDTIEFNASSFKTLPTALVEDLLRKLPGVIIDESGNIRVNGKRVNRILVDGQAFFGSDPKMATKNLPANIIDKVQVTVDANERDENPDILESQLGSVINLRLKRSVKKSWFGKASAGRGTNKTYEVSGLLNHFRDTFQISILGYANNINKAAFGYSDLQNLGGFKRSGSLVSITESGGVRSNNISFGGTGGGIQESQGGGFNINNELNKKVTANLQYFYGHTNNLIHDVTLRRQFFDTATLNTDIDRRSEVRAGSHRLGGIIKWKINTFTRFEYRPSFNITSQKLENRTTTSNQDQNNRFFNKSQNAERSSSNEDTYSHSMLLSKNFRKKGRNLSLTNAFLTSVTATKQSNVALDSFFNSGFPYRSTLNQSRDREQTNLVSSLTATFTEPLMKTLSMRFSHNFSYVNGKDRLSTFQSNPITGKFDSLNANLSNQLFRKSLRNYSSSGINWTKNSLALIATGGFLRFDAFNNFKDRKRVLNQHFNYFVPALSLSWKQISLSYTKTINAPFITDLSPVPDSSNPIFVVRGNPGLKPSTNNSMSLNYYKYDQRRSLSTNVYITSNARKNAIMRARNIDRNTIQTSFPVNVSSTYDLNLFGSVDKQIKLNKLTTNLRLDLSITRGNNYLILNGQADKVQNFEVYPTAFIRLNWQDFVELVLSANRSYNRAKYDAQLYPRIDTKTSQVYSEIIIRWPRNFVLESNFSYRNNHNHDVSIRNSNTLLNSGITWLFLTDKKGQLKLSVYDALNQNIGITRYTSENYITDTRSNVLKRYFMITFFYDIRGFNLNKIGGTNRSLLF